jgi:putative transposase
MSNHLHILLKSGHRGLSHFMRRFLTGYAVVFNLRHRRNGHLFKNRYKSIVCDEDAYFQELVRYIHLNPLRAGMVKNMSELDRYPWCGHSRVMGRVESEWQDVDYVLFRFGRNEANARKAYRRYVQEGIKAGRREDLVGGGLIRTLGGWSRVISLRQSGDRILCDDRILGQDEFVKSILAEADKRIAGRISINERIVNAKRLIFERCDKESVSIRIYSA